MGRLLQPAALSHAPSPRGGALFARWPARGLCSRYSRAHASSSGLRQHVRVVRASARPRQAFQLVFLKKGWRFALGNGLRLVQWSADGRFLLVEVWIGQFASDWASNDVLVYDARDDLAVELPLARILKDHFGKGCEASVNPLGFDEKDRVLLDLNPWFEEGDDQPAAESCLRAQSVAWPSKRSPVKVRWLRRFRSRPRQSRNKGPLLFLFRLPGARGLRRRHDLLLDLRGDDVVVVHFMLKLPRPCVMAVRSVP